jgi:predicted XRE-type DNA-binding protein
MHKRSEEACKSHYKRMVREGTVEKSKQTGLRKETALVTVPARRADDGDGDDEDEDEEYEDEMMDNVDDMGDKHGQDQFATEGVESDSQRYVSELKAIMEKEALVQKKVARVLGVPSQGRFSSVRLFKYNTIAFLFVDDCKDILFFLWVPRIYFCLWKLVREMHSRY